MKNPQSDFKIFTFSECKDDLTSWFTAQSIVVVALSTASVCRPRAPSAGAPTLCPLAPHPPAPQHLPLACQAASRLEPVQTCQLPGLALHLKHWVVGKPGQAPGCFLPDLLVVSVEGLVDVEKEDKVLGLLKMGLLAGTLEQLRGQQLRLVVM